MRRREKTRGVVIVLALAMTKAGAATAFAWPAFTGPRFLLPNPAPVHRGEHRSAIYGRLHGSGSGRQRGLTGQSRYFYTSGLYALSLTSAHSFKTSTTALGHSRVGGGEEEDSVSMASAGASPAPIAAPAPTPAQSLPVATAAADFLASQASMFQASLCQALGVSKPPHFEMGASSELPWASESSSPRLSLGGDRAGVRGRGEDGGGGVEP
ncbi:unnamed protein product, partial [Discosporangium mesarthrocarpum]